MSVSTVETKEDDVGGEAWKHTRPTNVSVLKALELAIAWRVPPEGAVPHMPPPQGYVYAIATVEERPAVKIGMSGNPERRLKQIQTGNPKPLAIVACIRCANASATEAFIHEVLNFSEAGAWPTDNYEGRAWPTGGGSEWYWIAMPTVVQLSKFVYAGPDLRPVTQAEMYRRACEHFGIDSGAIV